MRHRKRLHYEKKMMKISNKWYGAWKKAVSSSENLPLWKIKWEEIQNKNDHIKQLVIIALEIRKIERKLNKVKDPLWESTVMGFKFSIEKIYDILKDNKISIIDYTWKKYIEGMNGIEVVSVEKDGTQTQSTILDCINPLIEVNWVIFMKSKAIILSP